MRLILIGWCVIALGSLPIAWFAAIAIQRAPVVRRSLQPVEMTELLNSFATWIGFDGIPLKGNAIDIAHMHGSYIFGDLVAIRIQDITVDSDALDSISEPHREFLYKCPDDFNADISAPSWLQSPWLTEHGELKAWARLTVQDWVVWVYLDDVERELIVVLASMGAPSAPPIRHVRFSDSQYRSQFLVPGPGADWRKWALLRFE